MLQAALEQLPEAAKARTGEAHQAPEREGELVKILMQNPPTKSGVDAEMRTNSRGHTSTKRNPGKTQ